MPPSAPAEPQPPAPPPGAAPATAPPPDAADAADAAGEGGPRTCPYCRIVRGELPATVVYRDALLLAFLDPAPINPGHALLIPLAHHAGLTAVPPAVLAAMLVLAPRLAQALARVTAADGWNLHAASGGCAGQAVAHAHLHLVPRGPTDGFAWGWRARPYADPDEPARIAARAAARLGHDPHAP